MEEDLIKESPFEIEKSDHYTQRVSAKPLERTRNEKHRLEKVKATRSKEILLVNGESGNSVNH